MDEADVLLSICLIGRPSGYIYICPRAAHRARYLCYALLTVHRTRPLGRPKGLTISTESSRDVAALIGPRRRQTILGLGDNRDNPLGLHCPRVAVVTVIGVFHPPTHRTGMILLVAPIRYHRGSLSQRYLASQVNQSFGRPVW